MGISAAAVFWGGGQLLLAKYLPSGGGLRQEVFDALPWLALSLPVGILSLVLALAWTVRGVIVTVILFGLVRTARATLQPVIFPTLLVIGSAAATFSLPYAEPSRWVCAGAMLIISAGWVWNTAPPSVRNLLPTAWRRSPRLDSKEVES